MIGALSAAVAAHALAGCTDPRDADRRDGAAPGADGEPPLSELCTSQAAGASAFDDDLDGAIDEGCALSFGVAAPLAMLHRSSSPLLSPRLSDDKRRLYVVAAGTGELLVSHRPSRDRPFGAPAVAARWEGTPIVAAAISADELEVIVAPSDAPLVRATRGSIDDPFGPLEPITLTIAPPHHHPALSRDGRELFFVALDATPRQRVWRAVREARGAPFGAAEAILATDASISELTPSLTEDGRALLFSQNGALSRAVRAAPGAPFGPPEVIGGAAIFPFASLRTRELFFVGQALPWSPVPEGTVWRAEICTDAPCGSRAIACEGGTRSADEQHCYVPIRTPLPWSDARADCDARGAHLASIASVEELSLVASLSPGVPQWLGATDAAPAGECNLVDHPEGCGFDWIDHEAWIFAPWAAGEPSGTDGAGGREDCLAVEGSGTAFVDLDCAAPLTFTCERDAYPTW